MKLHFLRFVQANRVLTSLTFCGISGNEEIIDISVAEADYSQQGLSTIGAQILAAFISRKFFQDNGVLAKLKINICELPVQQLMTASELDLSGRELGVEDSIIIASCIEVHCLNL
jgi:hypothetical protein